MSAVFEVTGYILEMRQGDHGRHVGAFVECTDAAKAIMLVEKKFPGIRIENIIRKGSRIVILEAEHGLEYLT